MQPQFGDTIINEMASEKNPQRVGTFVEERYIPHGHMNAGKWWRCTDKKGEFWLLPANHKKVRVQRG